MTEPIEGLRAAWKSARALQLAAEDLAAKLARCALEAELVLLVEEGRGHCLRAGWIRAVLEERYEDARALLGADPAAFVVDHIAPGDA